MTDRNRDRDQEREDVAALRELVAPLPKLDLDPARVAKLRAEARLALASESGRARGRGWIWWRRLEPAFALSFGVVYMTLVLGAVLSIY